MTLIFIYVMCKEDCVEPKKVCKWCITVSRPERTSSLTFIHPFYILCTNFTHFLAHTLFSVYIANLRITVHGPR